MEKHILKVSGMSCAHCEKRVDNEIKSLDGVISCNADATNNQVIVSFDEKKINLDFIVKRINNVGYNVE